jgi:hypothetical protein
VELGWNIFSDNTVGAHKLSLFVSLKILVVNGIFLVTLFLLLKKESLARKD